MVEKVKLTEEDHRRQRCHCGDCFDPALEFFPRVFECGSCHQEVPWCRGAEDEYPELCDTCAVSVMEMEGIL